jgi:D-amino peptidase
MKVYISADIEGITGVTHWDETETGSPGWTEACEQMTREVNAACEGALAAGATEILVNDAHDSARNIITAQLPREVKTIRGWSEHPQSMVQELDGSFHALLMIGYHSRAGSSGSPLAHTLVPRVAELRLNGQPAGEYHICALEAARQKVPVMFLAGDKAICEEAQLLQPSLSVVAVQEGVGDSTISIHPLLAVERIREGVQAALAAPPEKLLVELPSSFQVEIRYTTQKEAYKQSFYPGAELIDPHTIRFETDDYFEVLRLLIFVA